MGAPVEWFDIMGKDGEQLKKFYSSLFGWKINSDNPMNYGVTDTDSGRGIGGGIATDEQGQPSVTIYITVKDINAKLKEIKTSGGSVLIERTVIPEMVTFAIFSDPDGNKIGLVEETDCHDG